MLPQDVVERVRGYIQHQGAKPPESIAGLVAAGQAKLLDACAGIDEGRASRRPAEGEWSLRELMLHVITAEAAVATLLGHLSNGTSGTVPDRVLGMQREDDGATFAALLDELRETNARMLEAVRAVPPSVDLSRTPKHPFFGPLNAWEWAAFQRVHDEDHVQHAQKILAATA